MPNHSIHSHKHYTTTQVRVGVVGWSRGGVTEQRNKTNHCTEEKHWEFCARPPGTEHKVSPCWQGVGGWTPLRRNTVGNGGGVSPVADTLHTTFYRVVGEERLCAWFSTLALHKSGGPWVRHQPTTRKKIWRSYCHRGGHSGPEVHHSTKSTTKKQKNGP